MFVGRKNELQLLKDAHASDKSELVVLYGRRRIGKSSLVHQFAQDKADFYRFEALEGESTPEQIRLGKSALKPGSPQGEGSNFTWTIWNRQRSSSLLFLSIKA